MRELVFESDHAELLQDKVTNFKDYLVHCENRCIAKKMCEYWLMQDDTFIGMIQIRHKPSSALPGLESHVYYEIVPTERKKGYGKIILNLGKEKARVIGLTHLLIATEENNTASKTIIQQNGGALLKKSPDEQTGINNLLFRISL